MVKDTEYKERLRTGTFVQEMLEHVVARGVGKTFAEGEPDASLQPVRLAGYYWNNQEPIPEYDPEKMAALSPEESTQYMKECINMLEATLLRNNLGAYYEGIQTGITYALTAMMTLGKVQTEHERDCLAQLFYEAVKSDMETRMERAQQKLDEGIDIEIIAKETGLMSAQVELLCYDDHRGLSKI